MNTNTKIVVAAGLTALIGAGAGYLLLSGRVQPETVPAGAARLVSPRPGVAKQVAAVPAAGSVTSATGRVSQPVQKTGAAGSTNEIVVAADRAEAEKMEERVDSEDFTAALKIARQLMRSKDEEVRSRVVSSLGWIGIKALPELSEMLADENEDIAAEAFQQWKEMVDEVADEAMKGSLIVAGMTNPNMKNQGDLEACVMEFDSLRDDIAVRGLVSIIQSSNPVASEVARDHYTFVTGTDYTTPEEAEKWISENVEPEEDEKPAETATKK